MLQTHHQGIGKAFEEHDEDDDDVHDADPFRVDSGDPFLPELLPFFQIGDEGEEDDAGEQAAIDGRLLKGRMEKGFYGECTKHGFPYFFFRDGGCMNFVDDLIEQLVVLKAIKPTGRSWLGCASC